MWNIIPIYYNIYNFVCLYFICLLGLFFIFLPPKSSNSSFCDLYCTKSFLSHNMKVEHIVQAEPVHKFLLLGNARNGHKKYYFLNNHTYECYSPEK